MGGLIQKYGQTVDYWLIVNLKWFTGCYYWITVIQKFSITSRYKEMETEKQEAKKEEMTPTALKDLIQACVQALSDNRSGNGRLSGRVHLRTGSGGIH